MWKSKSVYIDIDTGEIIDKDKAKKEYIIVRTETLKICRPLTNIIEYTHECKRKKYKQTNLFD